jgi:hypothetical protein
MDHATLNRARMRGVTARPTRLMAPSLIGASSLGLLPRGKVPQSISIRIEGRQRLKVQLNLKVDGVRENQAIPHS